jgi:ADP-ribose pyrophosphatase YjhB (NUDIX family)
MDGTIRLRACLAVVQDNKILLVAHYNTDVGPIQWLSPGGGVEFGESVQAAALREFTEETGLDADIEQLIDVSEVIRKEPPWHSVSITFLGRVIGGEIKPEVSRAYGKRDISWFSAGEVLKVQYHPQAVIEKALGINGR